MMNLEDISKVRLYSKACHRIKIMFILFMFIFIVTQVLSSVYLFIASDYLATLEAQWVFVLINICCLTAIFLFWYAYVRWREGYITKEGFVPSFWPFKNGIKKNPPFVKWSDVTKITAVPEMKGKNPITKREMWEYYLTDKEGKNYFIGFYDFDTDKESLEVKELLYNLSMKINASWK